MKKETATSHGPSQTTRRDFLHTIGASGLLFGGLGAFLQSCAEKEIKLTQNLAKAYFEGIIKIISEINDREMYSIKKAAVIAVQSKLQGRNLYSHITGAMFPAEIAIDRPGSPRLFLTENIEKAGKDDVLITNDPQIARGLGEQYVRIIGITTPFIPSLSTPPNVLENMGSFAIEDVSDVIINCHVPYTDGILKVENTEVPIAPASGIIHSMIYYSLVGEILEEYAKSGIYPEIG